jgi:hypothetical protein
MQASWHTVHKLDSEKGLLALDQLTHHTPHLTLFRIPRSARRQMLRQVEGFGVSVTTVFGDLTSLCGDIRDRHQPMWLHKKATGA